jgi:NAD(P)-dependent dehydrogenase (short-subunit alcohol dehydrogenase family)
MSADPGAVLITGCSSGIGRTTALRLAGRGRTVYATARRPESIDDLARAGCKTLALDVTDEASMRSAVGAVEAEQGAVGALVNNAGYSQSGALETLPMERLRRQFETNVFGLVRMCQLVLPGMRAAGRGRIVNVSSMGGKLVFPGGGAYHASKFAVEALSDALRFEVRGFGIRVVIVEPGLITTKFGETAAGSLEGAAADEPDRADDPYASFNAAVGAATVGVYEGPMKRLGGGPETVARTIERAISSPNPKPRYKVTASARLALGQRKLLTDRAWDAVMRSQFPSPGS